VRWRQGDSDRAIEKCAHVVESSYDVPYLAHATMEPMNATARVTEDLCEVWAPSQSQDRVGAVCRQLTGLPAERIRVYTTLVGGAFGRRSVPDFVIEAVTLSRDLRRPIKVIWSREEDMRHDRYRPMAAMRFRAGLDGDGRLEALEAHIAAPKISASLIADFPGYYTPWPSAELSVDAVPGISDMAYSVSNLTVRVSEAAPSVPLGYWRSVDYSHNGFFLESFIDEVAGVAGVDPYEYRLALLRDQPRLRAVLERVIDESGWTRRTAGRYRGVAVLAAYGSFVATVIELSVAGDLPRVHEVHCAVDCGVIVDRRNLEAQIQGAVGFGLTAALSGEIHVRRGRVVQSNFHDYRILRMSESPKISVYLSESDAAPGGAGELGVPTVAPALTSAWAAATGKRCRSLPLLKVRGAA
jgi:isoquinoline 1-oxidoreductase beta subunit